MTLETDLKTKMLLVTANVGSIFEKLSELMEPWLAAFTAKVVQYEPTFIALHMQEIGGKDYKKTIQSIDPFFKEFLSHPVIRQSYGRYIVLVDSDFTDEVNFTSLCSFYLIHDSMPADQVEMFDFNKKDFFQFKRRQFFTGNLKHNSLVYKERYEKDFFKEFQWSRKGFIQTKWRVRGQVIDFINIHLFHDASNIVALSTNPSLYSLNRKRALEYSINRIEANQFERNDNNNSKPVFAIFGDFNFRVNQASLLNENELKEAKRNELTTIDSKTNNEKISRLFWTDNNDESVLVIEDKKFKWKDEESIIKNNILAKHDNELDAIDGNLFEFNKTFPPSYPFSESLNCPRDYMGTRCPSWCDRILVSEQLRQLLIEPSNTGDNSNIKYEMIGQDVCMGDHKVI
jgi:inositol polyphosphate 5-phosphatase INPP5A